MISLLRPLARAAALICLGIAILAHVTQATPGQPGTLDATWASMGPLGPGKLIGPVGPGADTANALLLQPDNNIVLAGQCYNGSTYDFCAMRFLPTGVPDTSFGSTGKVTTPMGTSSGYANAVLQQPDGKILLAGSCIGTSNSDFCIVRYMPNGALDASFNGNGKVITSVGASTDNAAAALLQPDGKIVLAGQCVNGGNLDFCAVRYLPSGVLDMSFNGTGKVIAAVGLSDDIATTALLQPDGKIVVAGYCVNGSNFFDFCAARYLANGSLDSSFNGIGTIITPVGTSFDYATAALLQHDGKIVVTGRCFNSVNDDFCAVRYLNTGALDTSFNGTGKVITPVGAGDDSATAALLQPDGKLVLTGYCNNGSNTDFCALRYLPTGALDVTFNGTGKVTTAVGDGNDSAFAALLQPDGKLVLAGSCNYVNASLAVFCAVRYDGGPLGNQNCMPDLDGDGRFLATTDALIYTRVALGITGPAVISGVTFAPNATRNTWPLIRDYLITQCGLTLLQ